MLKHLTVQSVVFSGYFTVKRIGTVAVHSTIVQSGMATVEEFVQMMNTLQGQQHALNQEVLRLTAENLQFRQAGSPWLAEIATTAGQVIQTAISNANPTITRTTKFGRHQRSWEAPDVQGEPARFTDWLLKTSELLIAACGTAFQSVIEWVEDQDNVITNEAHDRQFGPTGAEPVEDVQDRTELVHVALLALRESESFDIVLVAAPFRSRSVETVGPWLGLSDRRKA